MTDEANQQREAVLLPCPFCGGRARMDYALADLGDWEVSCKDCCSSGGNFNEDVSAVNKTKAIAAWNTRAQTDALKKERDAIVEYTKERSDAEHDKGYGREALALALLADDLERGDHIKDQST